MFVCRKVVATEDITSSSNNNSTMSVNVDEEQPSTSSSYKQDDSMGVLMTSHVDDVANDTVTNTVTMVSLTSSPPVEGSSKKLREQDNPRTTEATSSDGIEQRRNTIEQEDVFSVKLFTSSSSMATDDAPLDNTAPAIAQQNKICHRLLEEKLLIPSLQQDAPLCCSTPDKMECNSLEAKRLSRSPSIPLQNTSAKMAKVDVTPTVLPQRMIALEGLYPDDSTDSDHSHDSLDLFDDPVSKDDHNLAIINPTVDQHQSSLLLHHVDMTIDTTPSLSALGDSISTQVSIYI